MQRREPDDQRDAERERPERAQRLAGGPPAAPGREQQPEPDGEPAVVARLLDEEGGSGEEARRRTSRRSPPRSCQRAVSASATSAGSVAISSPLAVKPSITGDVESRPLSSAAAAPARRPATLRHQQAEHDGDGARPERRHQADVERGADPAARSAQR